MNFSARVLSACLPALLLAWIVCSAGCNYVKPVMNIEIVNQSGHPIENLEVKHPTGIFGMPELRDGQTHRYLAPIGTPCRFSINFEDQTGKTYTSSADFGAKCPTEVAFDVGEGMKVSSRQVRP